MIILDREKPLRNPDCPTILQEEDKTIVVYDLEFLTNLAKHADYERNDGSAACKEPRWPFAEIVCASWVVIRFPAGAGRLPEVGRFHSLRRPDMDEIDIADHFFRQVLERETDGNGDPARLVSWAGDWKDNEVLRRVAMTWGITAPPQLRSTDPRCPLRLDLCQDTRIGPKKSVHLSEYAQAQGLPGKLFPARGVGEYAETGNWKTVENQCVNDVLLTAILACRRLSTLGEIGQTGKACTRALIERYCERGPSDSTRIWSRWRKENLGYRGTLTCRDR